MRSSHRTVSALFTLLALMLTLAEGVWASTCTVGMPMTDAPAASGSVHAHGMEMAAPAADHLAGVSATEPGPSAPLHCPFAPAAGSCQALAISLPADRTRPLSPAPAGALAVTGPDRVRPLLLVSSLFRPPRA